MGGGEGGIEPTVPVSRNNRLAGDPDQPLQHLSAGVTGTIVTCWNPESILALYSLCIGKMTVIISV